ncbi:MAG TPA: acyl-CoA synthetase [Longimicrobiales bacterium]|nr:acyl-CoA synthetase [Longimicrobiales bacterium]
MTFELARRHTLGDLPRRTAARVPSKTAIIDGETRLTFAELDAAVNRVANALVERGFAKGDRLAVLSRNRWEYAALSFASARLGVILVPINFMLNAEEVAFIFGHAEIGGVAAEASLVAVADAGIAKNPGMSPRRVLLGAHPSEVEGWEPFARWLESSAEAPPDVVLGDDDPVRLMYTSGTESRPKGALLSSRGLMWQYVSCALDGGMSGDDIELHALPLYHCAQLDCFLGPDVYLGATSIIIPAPDPEVVLRLIEKHRVTKFFAPPTVWISLLRSPSFESTDLSSLTKGYYGASAMPVEILREIDARLPHVRLWNFYGQTEMSPLATILQPHEQMEHAGSAGRPSLNVETFVVDDENVPLPIGQVGEIVHRSPHATLGYFKDPDKTAEAFAGGWFHSGDLGVFDEHGLLRVVDRKKDMIKTGGENVASREVEEAIYLHDAVAEVAVFGVPDPRWVEAVAAVVVPREGAQLSPGDVLAHCRERLAGYKVPKQVVIAEALPKNPSGKILKRVLRDGFDAT